MSTHDDMVPKSTGKKKGDSGADVRRLQAWLTSYGYLDSPVLDEFGLSHASAEPAPEKMGDFDDNTERALENMQAFHGLEPTGKLDSATLEVLGEPRCGVPDAPAANGLAGLAEIGRRWDSNHLRWGLGTLTGDLTTAQVRSSMQIGLGLWSAVTPLTFAEASFASNPEIRIYFGPTNHPPCPSVFGATTLAHAYYPPPNNGDFAGDAHFNTAYTWSVNSPPSGIDLPTVAGHEFGHSLGLAHSDVAGALMFPSYGGLQRQLHQNDIDRIQALYGQQQTLTRTLARVYATPHTANAWVLPTGMGWLKIRPTAPDGVTNTYASFVSARKAGDSVTFQVTDGQITNVYR